MRDEPIVVASANPDKVAEIRALMSDFDLLPRPAEVPDVDETGETLEDNERLKAVALVQATGFAAVADDTGLEVDALEGAPGVRSSRFAGEDVTYDDNVNKLLDALQGVPAEKRTARFRTVALLRRPDGSEVIAEGVVEGVIAEERHGLAGFGYDPVFQPNEGGGHTFGQMSPSEKAEISHRGRAFRALAEQL